MRGEGAAADKHMHVKQVTVRRPLQFVLEGNGLVCPVEMCVRRYCLYECYAYKYTV